MVTTDLQGGGMVRAEDKEAEPDIRAEVLADVTGKRYTDALRVTATLIAKGESRRLPGKNLKLLCGIPLVEWTLIQASAAKCINSIYMTTDSEAIAKIAWRYDACVVWQEQAEIDEAEARGKLGGTYAVRRGIRRARADGECDIMVSLLPTSPLRLPGEIDTVFDYWKQKPEWWTATTGQLKNLCLSRRAKDDLFELCLFDNTGEYYLSNGTIGMGYPEVYLAQKGSYHDGFEVFSLDNEGHVNTPNEEIRKHYRHRYFVHPLWLEYDIDYQEDFDLVEYYMKNFILKGKGPEIYERA